MGHAIISPLKCSIISNLLLKQGSKSLIYPNTQLIAHNSLCSKLQSSSWQVLVTHSPCILIPGMNDNMQQDNTQGSALWYHTLSPYPLHLWWDLASLITLPLSLLPPSLFTFTLPNPLPALHSHSQPGLGHSAPNYYTDFYLYCWIVPKSLH